MRITPLTEIGKHRPLCEANVRVAASGATHSAERRAYVARKAGHPVDQCGKRGDMRVDGAVLCRPHAQAKALEHVMEAETEIQRLRDALEAVRDDLHNENRLNTLSIACTIWHGPAETTVDFIDATLGQWQ